MKETFTSGLALGILIGYVGLAAPLIALQPSAARAETARSELPSEWRQRAYNERVVKDLNVVCKKNQVCVENQVSARSRMIDFYNAATPSKYIPTDTSVGWMPAPVEVTSRAYQLREIWKHSVAKATDKHDRTDWISAERIMQDTFAERNIEIKPGCVLYDTLAGGRCWDDRGLRPYNTGAQNESQKTNLEF